MLGTSHKLNHSVFFLYEWLILLSISSRFNNVAAYSRIPFFLKADDGYLVCFHILAIVNNASENMEMQISFWVPYFSSLG